MTAQRVMSDTPSTITLVTPEPLRGVNVLVVEDNGMLCCVLEETLRDAGCHVIGPHSRLRDAMQAVPSESIDIALLDLNLKGELVSPLADELEHRGVPYLLTSAYPARDLPASLQAAPQLRKPYTDTDLLERLAALLPMRRRNN
jgi:CheY-like chemotaxis protein